MIFAKSEVTFCLMKTSFGYCQKIFCFPLRGFSAAADISGNVCSYAVGIEHLPKNSPYEQIRRPRKFAI